MLQKKLLTSTWMKGGPRDFLLQGFIVVHITQLVCKWNLLPQYIKDNDGREPTLATSVTMSHFFLKNMDTLPKKICENTFDHVKNTTIESP